eukprot:m.10047 g.10047  ORF g.10047 m.10047 type:complete len:108 (-) comp3598_c0_seq1:1297-1620(-)
MSVEEDGFTFKLLTLVFVFTEGRKKILLGMKKRGFGKDRFNGFGLNMLLIVSPCIPHPFPLPHTHTISHITHHHIPSHIITYHHTRHHHHHTPNPPPLFSIFPKEES